MRLGTSMLSQWNRLFERAGDGRVVCNRRLFKAYISQFPARGIEHLEFTWDPPQAMEELFDEAWRDYLMRCQSDWGLTYSVHLPQFGLDVAALHQKFADMSLEETVKAIACTRDLPVANYVLHVGVSCARLHGTLSELSPPMLAYYWDETVASARRTLSRLVEHVDSRKIAVEDLPYAPFEPLVPVILECDLGVCLDVGHADRWGDDPAAFFVQYKDRISEIHFHDVKDAGDPDMVGVVPDHQALGSGHIGYRELIDAFAKEGFEGELTIEVQTPEDERVSVERARAYLASR